MKKKIKTQELVIMALLAAILCVSSYINIPLPFSPVPITAQVLAVFVIALLLRPKMACLTVVVWILLGLIGLPVFSGGRGGFGVLAGPTGGFLIGYLLAVLMLGGLGSKSRKTVVRFLILVCVGIPLIYIPGVCWMKFVTNVTWQTVFVTGVLPFLPWDVLKGIVALVVTKPLYSIIGLQNT